MKDSFVVVADFEYSSEAQISKGQLESEGIEVQLQDEFTVDTDPFASNAIGGVKLKVKQSDYQTARELLKESGVRFIGDFTVCEKCFSNEVSVVWSLKTIIKKLFPFGSLLDFKCLSCGHKFKAADNT